MANAIEIVIGSWGSYNACNERSLGSKWLTLNEYEDWEEIEEELKSEGFDLDGIDEELFIQDISGFVTGHQDWDYVNPQALFEILQEAGILADEYLFEVMAAYCEVEGYSAWERLVRADGDRWADDIYIYPNFDYYDLGYHYIHELSCLEIPDWLQNFIDYKAYGESLRFDGFYEYSGGIIEIR